MAKAAAEKPTAPKNGGVTFYPDALGTLNALWPSWVVRFMFDDGTTVDVRTMSDSSHLRGALLEHLGKNAIVGSTTIKDSVT
jgi:hypothetical protein